MAGVRPIADPAGGREMGRRGTHLGMPMCPRKTGLPRPEQKATARPTERDGLVYEESNLIVAHMGGGISVAAHKQGRRRQQRDGDGLAPTARGSIPSSELIKVCFSGQYTKEELLKFISSKGGLVAYLGTNSVIQVMERIAQGDQRAKKGSRRHVLPNIVKQIGAMAAALSGSVQAIVLTGGIAYNEPVVEYIRERCSFIARSRSIRARTNSKRWSPMRWWCSGGRHHPQSLQPAFFRGNERAASFRGAARSFRCGATER